MYNDFYNDELYHYGVKGMKWGVRRYMNADGSLTPAGMKRYGNDKVGQAKLAVKSARKEYSKSFDKAYSYSSTPRFTKKGKAERDRRWEDTFDKLDKLDKAKADYKRNKKQVRADMDYMRKNGLYNNTFTTGKDAKWISDKNKENGKDYVDYLYKKGRMEDSLKVATSVAAMGVGYAAAMAIIISKMDG